MEPPTTPQGANRYGHLMYKNDGGRDWLRYATVGTEFGLTFILMLGLGYWLDIRDGESLPAYMLTCGALGFAVALYRLLRQAQEIRKQDMPGQTDQGDRKD